MKLASISKKNTDVWLASEQVDCLEWTMDHFELLILELMQQDLKILWPRPGCSIHEPRPPIFSHSTLCLRWQPMRGDGGWRGSSHVQWLFSPQTPVWNCFPTWSSKINKDIQSKGSKWYPKWEVRIWSEANENVAHPRIIWFTPLLPMVKSNPSLDLNGHLT